MATQKLLCLILLVAGTKGDVFDYNFEALSSPRMLSDALESFLLRNATAVSWNCSAQLSEYVVGLRSREEWALKMYDSTGKLPAGVLDGNLAELGSFDECLYVTKLNEEPEGSSFTGQYCLGSIYVNATRNISAEILFGVFANKLAFSTCLPDACSDTDVQTIIRGIGINFTTEDPHCQTLAKRPELDTGGIIGLTITVCLALLMVASTIYDIRNKFTGKRAPNRLLSAFSIYTNLKNIFNTKSAFGEITCLHGVRSIAMFIVVIAIYIRFSKSTGMNPLRIAGYTRYKTCHY
ncbi:nose resistant to fluoxetine protein 6-like isoform X1 [Photinus pyralis]|uniref:nose resistant to fluoxetine protein 6-like isoform X1 n=1 Tax=Photinus pyralis TaxID=7054 RepID=UPI0012676098|nr:nose resistant to fluoxetine protein 6-like isoform X1 [Photinus pyralis]XP_031331440.1 nose resistant to fluoxetine protein 6-like isoform X1 [Photinus pyralis]XP_031331442.1 nose resistant to fluoxetine protein 6-like isoform X1 [Photinus pyralis]XP_031331443.1 nose resistant to fluoxetine protein 6-like isoform X1 [Photinus pyralis]